MVGWTKTLFMIDILVFDIYEKKLETSNLI